MLDIGFPSRDFQRAPTLRFGRERKLRRRFRPRNGPRGPLQFRRVRMMLWSWILGASLASGSNAPSPTSVRVAEDSGRHELTITSGPFDLPNMPPMDDHAMM